MNRTTKFIIKIAFKYCNIIRKPELLKPKKFNKNAGLRFSVEENILKRSFQNKNDDIVIIMLFPCPCFIQTQIQNDQWVPRFKISPA